MRRRRWESVKNLRPDVTDSSQTMAFSGSILATAMAIARPSSAPVGELVGAALAARAAASPWRPSSSASAGERMLQVLAGAASSMISQSSRIEHGRACPDRRRTPPAPCAPTRSRTSMSCRRERHDRRDREPLDRHAAGAALDAAVAMSARADGRPVGRAMRPAIVRASARRRGRSSAARRAAAT